MLYRLRRTELFRGIEDLVEQYTEKCGDVNEAEQVAWNDRRFALKLFIEANQDDIAEQIFKEDDE